MTIFDMYGYAYNFWSIGMQWTDTVNIHVLFPWHNVMETTEVEFQFSI